MFHEHYVNAVSTVGVITMDVHAWKTDQTNSQIGINWRQPTRHIWRMAMNLFEYLCKSLPYLMWLFIVQTWIMVFMMSCVPSVPWQLWFEKNTEFCWVFLLKHYSWDTFFPLGLQEHVLTHNTHYWIWPDWSINIVHQ